MKTRFDYHVVCHRDDNGSCVAYGPAIAGCHALGSTPEAAQQELHNGFDMMIEAFAERGLHSPAAAATYYL